MVDRGDRDCGRVPRYLGHLGAYVTLSRLDIEYLVPILGHYEPDLQDLRVIGGVGRCSDSRHFCSRSPRSDFGRKDQF